MKLQILKKLHWSVYLQNGDGEDPAFCKIKEGEHLLQHSTILIVRSERTIRLIHYIQRYFIVKNEQYILKENVSSKALKYPMQETEPLLRFYCTISTAHVTQSDFKNPGIFCFWNYWDRRNCFMECEILGFGIQKLTQGIRNPADDWIPLTRNLSGIQYLESRMHSLEFRIHDFFGLPYMGLSAFLL